MRTRAWLWGMLLAVGAITAAVWGWMDRACAGGDELRFAVIGDNRPGSFTARQPYVHRLVLKQIMARKPTAVFNTGDIIVGGTDDSLILRRMFREFVRTCSVLTVPVHIAPGNHDYFSEQSRRLYEEMIGSPYYSVDYGNCHFVILCSEEDAHVSRLSPEQQQWLKKDLAEHSQRQHLFVFVHRPFYPVGPHAGDSFDKYPAHRDSLAALLLDYGVDILFVGHEHLYQEATHRGLRQIIVAGGGAPLYAPPDSGGYFHFVLVTVRGQEIVTEVVRVEDPYEQAATAINHKRPTEALQLMDEVLTDDPQQAEALLYKALAYWQLGQPLRAAQNVAEFLRKEERSVAAYERAGRILIQHAFWEQARAVYLEFANDKPAAPQAYLGLGECLFQLGLPDSAGLCIERAVALDSLAPRVRFLAGQLYESGKNTMEAARHYRAAVRLSPKGTFGVRAARRLKELAP